NAANPERECKPKRTSDNRTRDEAFITHRQGNPQHEQGLARTAVAGHAGACVRSQGYAAACIHERASTAVGVINASRDGEPCAVEPTVQGSDSDNGGGIQPLRARTDSCGRIADTP